MNKKFYNMLITILDKFRKRNKAEFIVHIRKEDKKIYIKNVGYGTAYNFYTYCNTKTAVYSPLIDDFKVGGTLTVTFGELEDGNLSNVLLIYWEDRKHKKHTQIVTF